jgi:predicted kinase
MRLIILIGLQASGKSTFAKARFPEVVYVSKDAMGRAKRKWERQERLVRAALAAGQDVLVDNTNPTPAVRAPLIALGRDYGAEVIGYYLATSVQDALARNRTREGKARVPDVALYSTRAQLTLPSYAEGFDRLYRVTSDVERHDFHVETIEE